MGKSAPAAPDPVQTAQAQGAANEATARVTAKLNRPDTYGPGGSTVTAYGVDGDQDHTQVTTTLSPAQQRIYDSQQSLTETSQNAARDSANRMANLLSSPIDTSDLTPFSLPPDMSKLPALQTALSGAGQGLTTSLGSAGKGINTNFDSGSALSRIGVDDYSADRTKVEDAIMSRLQPQDDRDRASLEARLAAQGFQTGTQGYKDAADELNRRATDERMQAVLAGGQEQSRLFGLNATAAGFNNSASQAETQARNNATVLGNQAQQQGFSQEQAAGQFANAAQDQAFTQGATAAGFGNTARSQALQEGYTGAQFSDQTRAAQLAEKLQLRAQPINETSALFGLGNGVTVPAAAQVSPVQVGSPDYQGLVTNQSKAAQAAAASNNQATAQAAASAGMIAAAMISDRRVKDDVEKVGKLDNGLPVYSFRYKGDPKTQIGLMAQDVEKENPDAVVSHFGLKMVDYRKAAGA